MLSLQLRAGESPRACARAEATQATPTWSSPGKRNRASQFCYADRLCPSGWRYTGLAEAFRHSPPGFPVALPIARRTGVKHSGATRFASSIHWRSGIHERRPWQTQMTLCNSDLLSRRKRLKPSSGPIRRARPSVYRPALRAGSELRNPRFPDRRLDSKQILPVFENHEYSIQ